MEDENEQQESKLVPTPSITFDQFRAKIETALDHIESQGSENELNEFEAWWETLDAIVIDGE